MVKIIWLLFFTTLILFAEIKHDKKGFTLTDMNVREDATTESKIIDKTTYKEKIEILGVEYDKDGRYWYKTKYGYIYGSSITTDVRFVRADLLHIRIKPSLSGTEISYFLDGDKVIVIREAGSSDGYDWVLTTEGYVSSNYLTPSLVTKLSNKEIKDDIVEFYVKKDIGSQVVKTLPSKDLDYIVKEAIKIDPSKSKIEILKEQEIAVKLNKERIRKKQLYGIDDVTIKEQSAPQEVPIEEKELEEEKVYKFSFESIGIYYGNLNNSFSRTKDLGKEPKAEGTQISFSTEFSYNYFSDGLNFYISIENESYEMRTKQNILFGIKKYFSLDKGVKIFVLGGVGNSTLKWDEDPLSNSTKKADDASSIAYELGLGTYYSFTKNFLVELQLKQSRFSHKTDLTFGVEESTIEDTSTNKTLLGLVYKF